jgi:hypothetical protein
MCFNFFLLVDILTSLSFARRYGGESTTWYLFYMNRGIPTLRYRYNENLPAFVIYGVLSLQLYPTFKMNAL